MIVSIDAGKIHDWESFHDVFAEEFGFPDYYGRNMDAWIDLMTYLNDPKISDTKIKAADDEIVVLQLDWVAEFKSRCPDIYHALVECSAFVNYRQMEQGFDPVLALSFFMHK